MGVTFLIVFGGLVSTSFARNLFQLEASFDIPETLITSASGEAFVDKESVASSEFYLSPDVVSLLFNTEAAHEQYGFLEQKQEDMFNENLECVPILLGVDLCVVEGFTSKLCILSDVNGEICSTKTIEFTAACSKQECTPSTHITSRDYEMDYETLVLEPESEIIPTKLSSFTLSSDTNFKQFSGKPGSNTIRFEINSE